MEKKYIAPLTEIVYLSAGNILEGDGTQDSHGKLPPEIVDANSVTFDEEEANTNRSIWDD